MVSMAIGKIQVKQAEENNSSELEKRLSGIGVDSHTNLSIFLQKCDLDNGTMDYLNRCAVMYEALQDEFNKGKITKDDVAKAIKSNVQYCIGYMLSEPLIPKMKYNFKVGEADKYQNIRKEIHDIPILKFGLWVLNAIESENPDEVIEIHRLLGIAASNPLNNLEGEIEKNAIKYLMNVIREKQTRLSSKVSDKLNYEEGGEK